MTRRFALPGGWVVSPPIGTSCASTCDACDNGSFTIVGNQLAPGRLAVLVALQPPASNRYQRAIGVDLGEAQPDRDIDGQSGERK